MGLRSSATAAVPAVMMRRMIPGLGLSIFFLAGHRAGSWLSFANFRLKDPLSLEGNQPLETQGAPQEILTFCEAS